MNFWNFPSVIGGQKKSFNNAGIETFRAEPIESLTRETIQNSLDAVKDKTKPVVVEYHSFKVKTIPGNTELLDAFRKLKLTWRNNEAIQKFADTGIKELQSNNIEILRVSDFNTKGLEGAKTGELESPWSSLIKESGSSNKSDVSGGSFGIGKSAPILCSKLRTLFYSSLDIKKYASHIGMSEIMSFEKENRNVTLGTGYYTNSVESNAIYGLATIDLNFKRYESGTDIYITSFEHGCENWENEVLQSVLKNFFLTIFKEKLIVKINSTIIDHTNIAKFINQLDNPENMNLKQYFELVSSPDVLTIKYPSKDYGHGIRFAEGEAELRLKEGNDLNRRVLMTRKTGMRIYEQDRISSAISFTGVLHINGPNMNKFFKKIENPAHNAWEPNRYPTKHLNKLAFKVLNELKKFIRDEVKKAFQKDEIESMDVVGLNEFLPNDFLYGEKGSNKKEVLENTERHFYIIEKNTPKKNLNLASGEDEEKKIEQILGELGLNEGEFGGNGKGKHRDGESNGGGITDKDGNNHLDENNKGNIDIEEKIDRNVRLVQRRQKYICSDEKTGSYKFALYLERKITNGFLRLRGLGEQSEYKLNIRDIKFSDSKINYENKGYGKVSFKTPSGISNINFDVQINYNTHCAMEVDVFEN